MSDTEFTGTRQTLAFINNQNDENQKQHFQDETELDVDAKTARRVKTKADLILLPTLAIAYLLKFV